MSDTLTAVNTLRAKTTLTPVSSLISPAEVAALISSDPSGKAKLVCRTAYADFKCGTPTHLPKVSLSEKHGDGKRGDLHLVVFWPDGFDTRATPMCAACALSIFGKTLIPKPTA